MRLLVGPEVIAVAAVSVGVALPLIAGTKVGRNMAQAAARLIAPGRKTRMRTRTWNILSKRRVQTPWYDAPLHASGDRTIRFLLLESLFPEMGDRYCRKHQIEIASRSLRAS